MRELTLLLIALLTLGCAAPGAENDVMSLAPAAESSDADSAAAAGVQDAADEVLPPLEELFGRGAEDPGDYQERCINTRNIRTHRILDAQHIVFEMRRGELFLVQFPRRCFGLRRGDPITYRSTSARLCKLDDIRPLQFGHRGMEPGFPCFIPGFQRVSEDQVGYLKEAISARRRNARR